MDAILESGLIPALGPLGVSFVALICCYFMWQRQTDQFKVLTDRQTDLIKEIADVSQGLMTTQAESRARSDQSTRQITEFQLKMAQSVPSRDEMTNAIRDTIASVRDMMAPIREDVTFIKRALLSKGGKNDD
jgi:hypothetical protein